MQLLYIVSKYEPCMQLLLLKKYFKNLCHYGILNDSIDKAMGKCIAVINTIQKQTLTK